MNDTHRTHRRTTFRHSVVTPKSLWNPMKNQEELDELLRQANQICDKCMPQDELEYVPPWWSRIYLCLRAPRPWINRLALGRVIVAMRESGGHSALERYFGTVLYFGWQSTFYKCPWRRFKQWFKGIQ